jgi:hypothetical protein
MLFLFLVTRTSSAPFRRESNDFTGAVVAVIGTTCAVILYPSASRAVRRRNLYQIWFWGREHFAVGIHRPLWSLTGWYMATAKVTPLCLAPTILNSGPGDLSVMAWFRQLSSQGANRL